MTRRWMPTVISAILGLICLGTSFWFTTSYVHAYGEHSCQALTQLVQNRQLKTGDPSFYRAVLTWRNDDC